jgi:hypothetical protein
MEKCHQLEKYGTYSILKNSFIWNIFWEAWAFKKEKERQNVPSGEQEASGA